MSKTFLSPLEISRSQWYITLRRNSCKQTPKYCNHVLDCNVSFILRKQKDLSRLEQTSIKKQWKPYTVPPPRTEFHFFEIVTIFVTTSLSFCDEGFGTRYGKPRYVHKNKIVDHCWKNYHEKNWEEQKVIYVYSLYEIYAGKIKVDFSLNKG